MSTPEILPTHQNLPPEELYKDVNQATKAYLKGDITLQEYNMLVEKYGTDYQAVFLDLAKMRLENKTIRVYLKEFWSRFTQGATNPSTVQETQQGT